MKSLTCQQLKLLTLDQLVKRLGQENKTTPGLFDTFHDADAQINVIFRNKRMGVESRIKFGMTADMKIFSLFGWNLLKQLPAGRMTRMLDEFETACPEVILSRTHVEGLSDPTLQQSNADPNYMRFGFMFTLLFVQKVRRYRVRRQA